MATKFRKSNEEIERLSKEYNLDLSGKTYQEKCYILNEYEKNIQPGTFVPQDNRTIDPVDFYSKELHADRDGDILPNPSTIFPKGKSRLISPEIKPRRYVKAKYDEYLGEQYDVEEVHNTFTTPEFQRTDTLDSTFRVRKKGGASFAQSTLPKQQAEIRVDPTSKYAIPIVTFMNKRGYLWHHHAYTCVKKMLLDSGRYYDFIDKFNQPGTERLFYLTGLRCCDIHFADSVLDQIMKDANHARN